MGYLMPKLSLEKNSSGTIYPIVMGDKGVHTYHDSISPKVNAITQLEFELAYSFWNITIGHKANYISIRLH